MCGEDQLSGVPIKVIPMISLLHCFFRNVTGIAGRCWCEADNNRTGIRSGRECAPAGYLSYGNDSSNSVMDRFNRSHDVPNLFMCDGSSLVTGGRGQPTMTIMALAFRAADYMIGAARRGAAKFRA